MYPRDGEGEVSRDDMVAAFMDAEAIVARCGGHVSVVTDRARSEIPGEAYTLAAVFEWKDRTDARAHPERVVNERPAPQPDPEPAPEPPDPEPDDITLPDDPSPDGLVVEEEEDVSSIPVGNR